jgi:hypothetical protein
MPPTLAALGAQGHSPGSARDEVAVGLFDRTVRGLLEFHGLVGGGFDGALPHDRTRVSFMLAAPVAEATGAARGSSWVS